MKKRTLTLALITALTVSMHSSANVRENKDFIKQVSATSGKSIHVLNTNGSITIETWKNDSILVNASIEVRARHRHDAERGIDRVRVRIDESQNEMRIEAVFPKQDHARGFWDWVFGRKVQAEVQFYITVPQQSDLALATVNGQIDVGSVIGKVNMRTTNGDLRAETANGSIQANTTNGSIRIRCTQFKQGDRLDCRTVNGEVSVVVSKKIQAEVDLSTVNGQVTCDFPLEVEGGISNNHIRGRIGQGGGEIRCVTVNGSVSIRRD